MHHLSPVARISAGLVLVTWSILFGLDLLGLAPTPRDAEAEARVRLCETLAAQAAAAAERNDLTSVRAALQVAVSRNDDVLSAGVRSATGGLLVATPEHRSLWQTDREARAPTTHVEVPLFKDGRRWATIEVHFARIGSGRVLEELWSRPMVRLMVFVGLTGFVAYGFYMRRTLRHLDPSQVIPARVQHALDVMAEGVILVDAQQRIVLANSAFEAQVGMPAADLLGLDAASLEWRVPGSEKRPSSFPWAEALHEGEVSDAPLRLERDGDLRSFVVKGSPVLDGDGRAKGAIATFDDVTELERKSTELERALGELEKSQDEIRLQNEELIVLAQCDPLTGVSNRRHFLERLESRFENARASGLQLCCLMADIDHFKKINDTHGHLVGDEVIRRVAQVLKGELRGADLVCRYGGEEFCVLLEDVAAEEAFVVADRLRRRIAAPAFARVPVTASFGLSSTAFGAESTHELLKQADDALYESKETGRDRVTRWDQRSGATG